MSERISSPQQRPFPLPYQRRVGGLVLSRRSWLWLASGAVALAVWIYMIWAYRGSPGDDPFITFRYAYNLSHGNGFVFNPGEHVQSTTTPLFTLLLALGSLLGFDIPTLGYVLSGLFLLAAGVCCVGFLARALPDMPWIGLPVVILTFADPAVVPGMATEMYLLMALAWASWWAARAQRWSLAALLAGLAAVTRGDGVLVGLAIGVVYIATHLKTPLRRWPWLAALIYVVTVAPWYIFAWFYFGSPLPATLAAKVAQGTAPGTVSFIEGLWSYFYFRSFFMADWVAWLTLVLLVVGLAALLWRGWMVFMPILWAILFIAGFGLLNVPRYPWYYTPLVPVAMLAVVYGAAWVARALPALFHRTSLAHSFALGGALVACLVTGAVFLAYDDHIARPDPRPHSLIYIEAGNWLAANTPSGAVVGAQEVGYLGFYSQRRIIDLTGLIQPAVVPHISAGDYLWAVQTYQPDYLVVLPQWLATVGSNPWVKEHYSQLRTFDAPSNETAVLLQRR